MSLINDTIELNDHLRIVSQLNKLLLLDKSLTNTLVNTRYQVSEAYTKSDEFVYMQDKDDDIPTAGLIGILNGLAVNTNSFRIAAYYDDNDTLTHFILLENINGKFMEVKS